MSSLKLQKQCCICMKRRVSYIGKSLIILPIYLQPMLITPPPQKTEISSQKIFCSILPHSFQQEIRSLEDLMTKTRRTKASLYMASEVAELVESRSPILACPKWSGILRR